MGVLDKFLSIMKLDGDDSEYDEDELYEDEDEEGYYDDEDVEEEEEKPQRSAFSKKKESDEKDKGSYDDFDMEEKRHRSFGSGSGKVTPLRHAAGKRSGNMEVCVVKPSSIDDSREITETLLSGRTVILNLEGMDLDAAQRIIDFISGATFAINGNLQKISNYIFLVTPTNVDISGDLQDLLGGPMESQAIKTRF